MNLQNKRETISSDVPVVSMGNLTEAELKRLLLEEKTPVIITDFAATWPAYEKWDFKFLQEAGKGVKIPVMAGNPPIETPLGFDEFVGQVESLDPAKEQLRTFATTRGYSDLLALIPKLNDDFDNSCPIFGGFGGHWWPLVPPNRPQFYINSGGASTPLHYDVDGSFTFHTLLKGQKRFYILPYEDGHRIAAKRKWGFGLFAPTSADEALIKECATPVELSAGQTMVLPSWCWHLVETVEPSISLGLRAHGNSPRSIFRHYISTCTFPMLFLHRVKTLIEKIAMKQLGKPLYGSTN